MDIKSNKFTLNPTPPSQAEQDEKLRGASKDYEKYFLGEMVRAMRTSIPESEFSKKGMAEKIYSEQMDQEYVQNWSDRGGVGFADVIYQNIKERYFPESMTPPVPAEGLKKIESKDFFPLKSKDSQINMKINPSEELSLKIPSKAEWKFKSDLDDGRIALGFSHPETNTFSTFVVKGSSLLSQDRTLLEEGEPFAVVSPGEQEIIWKIRA